MEHAHGTATLTPAERHFAELVQQGDDFFKIELLRPARNRYSEALKLKSGNENLKEKIGECERLIKNENKIIAILSAIAVVAIALIIIL